MQNHTCNQTVPDLFQQIVQAPIILTEINQIANEEATQSRGQKNSGKIYILAKKGPSPLFSIILFKVIKTREI